MPYKDPAKRRAVQRESQARRRGASTPRQPRPPPALEALRYRTAEDVLRLLNEQVEELREDRTLTTAERARVAGFLAGIMLRSIETQDLARRLEDLEARFASVGALTAAGRRESSLGICS